MTVDSDTRITEGGHLLALWTGLLLAPLAWLLNISAGYALVPRACATGNHLPGHLVHLVCLLLALGGALVAWRLWQAIGSRWPEDEGGPAARSRFMAATGVLTSLLFALVIVAQWVPSFMISPCQ
jgi:hypothetical protein